MHAFSTTALKRTLRVVLAALLLVAALTAGLIALARLEPPLIDAQETPGAPENTAGIPGFETYETPGVCRVSLSCSPAVSGHSAEIYLTNPAENSVLLRAELYSVRAVTDEQTDQTSYLPDKLLGKTGFLHPGSYVKSVSVSGLRAGENTKVLVKISTMQEETRKSMGIFYIRTTIP